MDENIEQSGSNIYLHGTSVAGINWTRPAKPAYNIKIPRGIVKPGLFTVIGLTFVLVVWAILALGIVLQVNTQLPAQVLLAHYAHAKAGQPVAFNPDYVPVEQGKMGWMIFTNSTWIGQNVTNIVPYFAYEGIIDQPWYPEIAVFTPYMGEHSFTIAGSAAQYPYVSVFLNERLVLDPVWNDEREAFAVLTHELTHIQGGNFLWATELDGKPQPGVFESYTAAATTEMLAGMCNNGNKLACSAFWQDIEGKSRSYVRIVLHKHRLDWLYNAWAETFFVKDRSVRDKALRYWAADKDELYETVEKYDVLPYKRWIVPGVAQGWAMDTGVAPCHWLDLFTYVCETGTSLMQFDDTAYILGWWRLVFWTGWLR